MSNKSGNKDRISLLQKEIDGKKGQVMLSLCRLPPYTASANILLAYGNNTWMTREEALDLLVDALKAEGFTVMYPAGKN
jgi:hypothetical protein